MKQKFKPIENKFRHILWSEISSHSWTKYWYKRNVDICNQLFYDIWAKVQVEIYNETKT